MKKIFLALLFVSLSVAMAFGQTVTVKGRVVDKTTSRTIAGVTIYPAMVQQPFQTLADGGFLITVSKGEQSFIFNKEGYKPYELKVIIFDSMDFGDIVLTPLQQSVGSNDLPVVELSETELSEGSQSQDISGLLQSSNDVFTSTAGFVFGPARFRMRGYDSENTVVSINGANMNDVESGRAYWSAWGGLNDATREKEVVNTLDKADFAFGAIGGATNIDTRASMFSRGVKASYSYSNRSYSNRAMVTYGTGVMDNGWAFAFSGSRRWAQEGYNDGTFYDAWGYFAAAEKRINKNHVLNLTVFGAPTARGKSGASTQDMYDLAGSNYYNPYWGYQNGEKRNSRVSDFHKPVMVLNHDWKISEKANLKTSVLYTFGKGGNTALDWGDAGDPRPDYYRKLPNYYKYDVLRYNELTELYKSDITVRQINFDDMFAVNKSGVVDTKGFGAGNRSAYIIEERRDDESRLQANTLGSYIVNEDLKVKAGGSYEMYTGKHYKIVDDLLGGDFYLDIDKFVKRDASTGVFSNPDEAEQNDLNNPNRAVKVGDTFGYSYDTHVNTAKGWVQAEYSLNNTDIFVAGNVSNTMFWRTGNMRNGKFADNSFGDSEKTSFTNFGGKIGATQKITGRHYVSVNAMYETRTPKVRNAFTSARTRNVVVPGLKKETVYSGEATYSYRSPFISGRLTGYYTKFEDQMNVLNFYNDAEGTFGNYIMSGVDKQHMGIEFGIEAKVLPELKVKAVASIGEYTYTSNPTASLYQDNTSKARFEDRTINFNDYKVDGTPQQAFSIGLKYESPKYWWVSADANMFREIYMSMNPERRTDFAVAGVDKTSEKYFSIINQEKLDDAFTLDLSAGKSWRIDNISIYLSANITNVLNNQNFITGGYEQLRFDPTDVSKFGNKYYYMPGTQFFINLGVRL